MQHVNFCPRCGGTLIPPAEPSSAYMCTECGRPLYSNSKPCASALVVQEGKLLLIRRGIEPYKGYWDIPGGFLGPGEHPEDGARREILEETGLTVWLGELLGIWMDTYGPGEEAEYTLNCYYLATPVEGHERAADDACELGWFAPDELPEEIAFGGQAIAVLEAWKRRAAAAPG
jgi:8-oxo-dGTP diphosphatase